MMFRNGLVDLRTGEQVEASPKVWVHHAVGYDWDPRAQAPEWEKFLESIWPGDQEAKDCVEEALGLSMVEDHSFQKGFLLIGEKRGGKGTILNVLAGLVGAHAYGTLDFGDWMKSEFSRQGAIAKKVVAFQDVRLRKPHWYGANLDPGGLDQKSVALLLQWTAGEKVPWQRKNKTPWDGVAGTVWMASNEVPNFNDTALPTRFVKLHLPISFLGREDHDLDKRLLRALPGIAARAVRAYGRLKARDRFVQPRSADKLERDILKSSDPFVAWVLETFVPDAEGAVQIKIVHANFEGWCAEHGHKELLNSVTRQNMRKRICQVPGFAAVGRTFRPHYDNRRWPGLRFRRSADAVEE
jgi:putative DNA primase/helicase